MSQELTIHLRQLARDLANVYPGVALVLGTLANCTEDGDTVGLVRLGHVCMDVNQDCQRRRAAPNN